MDMGIYGYMDTLQFSSNVRQIFEYSPNFRRIFVKYVSVRRIFVKYLNMRRIFVKCSSTVRHVSVKGSSNVRQICEFPSIVVELSSNIVNYRRIIVKWILYT